MSSPGGWSRDAAGGGEASRGPGIWAALLAFGLLVAIAVGSVKILRERGGSTDAGSAGSGVLARNEDGNIDAIAIMSGVDFDAGAEEFKEADAVAIMGHTVLDLRQARVRGQSAVINVVAIMGHVELVVPPDWEVTTRDMLSAGAIKNMTRSSESENPKQVRIDGAVLMGRLDVRR